MEQGSAKPQIVRATLVRFNDDNLVKASWMTNQDPDPLACVPAQGSICVLLADAIAGDGLCQILVFDDADCTGAGQAFQFNAVGDSANAAFNSFKADCS